MPVREQQGDLFATNETVLAHGCNCAGAMGRGIAVGFKERWPAMFDEYRQRCRYGEFRPGGIFRWDDPDGTVIYNLGTQEHWKVRATFPFIAAAVSAMTENASVSGITQIGLPRVGSGLGGLSWVEVRDVIEQACHHDVTLVVYTP